MSQDRNKNEKENKDAPVKPAPETLHTPDPPKKMEGPVSSSLKDTGKAFDTNETKEEADRERDKNM